MTEALQNTATLLQHNAVAGAVFYLLVATAYALVLRRDGFLFLPGFLVSALWSFSSWGQVADYLFIGIWSACFLMVFLANGQMRTRSVNAYLLWLVPGLAIALGALLLIGFPASSLFTYGYLVASIGALLITEQLVRNNGGLIKAIGIGIGSLQLYNLYLYASALVVSAVSAEAYFARGLANTAVALVLLAAPLFISHESSRRRSLGISRPVAFTTSSLVLAGGLLIVVATLGYLMRVGGVLLSGISQPFLLFLGVLFIGLTLSSSTRRARLRVWINKNFFNAKYDYRNEWRRLNEQLSPTVSNFAATATRAMMTPFQGTGGTCYLREGEYYVPAWSLIDTDRPRRLARQQHQQFFALMETQGWIYIPAHPDRAMSNHRELIPADLVDDDHLLLIAPLLAGADLIGFITVSATLDRVEDMDWEDLDLVRMASGQIANYVAYQMLSDEVVVTRQFDAFHQFTTFVVHDLKNLIAQQALVVENANRFIDNPEFVKDAIKTIDNSVRKMNWMLQKLSQKSQVELDNPTLEPVDLAQLLGTVIETCARRKPAPEFRPRTSSVTIEADAEALTMAFTHLITNAQEACKAEDRVSVTLALEGDEAVCQIIDTGTGMDEEFIRNRLFKPFDSTKKNQGMGVGAYQCKQILSRMGGQISVSSKPGEGSCFTIILPVAVDASTSAQVQHDNS